MLVLQSMLGVALIPAIAWMISENRRTLTASSLFRLCLAGLGLQFVIGVILLRVPLISGVFSALAAGVNGLQTATEMGMSVVFGYLAGGAAPFEAAFPQNGFILAFRALPLILLVSVLSRILYHWGVLQRIVGAFAWVLHRTLGIGGALGTATAANVFVGMVEAPLLIRPYLQNMDRSALFATMTAGMATVAGTVMVLYAAILGPVLPGAAAHILAASVMSAPAALVIARLMVPPSLTDALAGEVGVVAIKIDNPPQSTMDAVTQGTWDGLKLLANVAAMLVVMIALVGLINMLLAVLGDLGGAPITAQRILGFVCRPLAWIIGIPWSEAAIAGQLIGVKIVLNELLAYLDLAQVPGDALSRRSRLILTYALCGFANFGSLGIMTGGLIAMVPERRRDILTLGPKTIVSGTLATMLTGAIIGVLTPVL